MSGAQQKGGVGGMLLTVWRNCVNRCWPLCVCLSACLLASLCLLVSLCMFACLCLSVSVLASLCSACVCLSVSLCLSICLHVCLPVCMGLSHSLPACQFVSAHLYVFKGNVQLPVTVTYTHSRRLRSNIWWQLYHVFRFCLRISSEPLYLLKPNLVWWCIAMTWSTMHKDCFVIFKVKVTVRTCIIKL